MPRSGTPAGTKGSKTFFTVGDLTDPAIAPAVVEDCRERFGRVDALFNVAGISGRKLGDGPIHECTEEGWATTLNTNATTQYRMCRETVRVMRAQDRGRNGQRGVILNMSSILGADVDRNHFSTVAYAANKGAVIDMSRSMAAHYAAEGVRVNVIAPGLVRTPMSARACEDAQVVEYMRIRQALVKDVIAVEDLAATCVHLLTDASRATTGQVIQVDGGWSIV
jgi:NAD(P)-dependent dehydrogenase (short-subunit alcohol dehydrogenase family)